jgi:hypothetical protein
MDFSNEFANLKSKIFGNKFRQKEKKGRLVFPGDAFSENKNSEERRQFTSTGHRFLKIVEKHGGLIFYSGMKKFEEHEKHDSKKLQLACLRKAFATLNRACEAQNKDFLILFDEHQTHLQKINFINSIYLDPKSKTKIADYPYDLKSDMYNNIQAADWVCALLGRIWSYKADNEEWGTHSQYMDKFNYKIEELKLSGSQVRMANH